MNIDRRILTRRLIGIILFVMALFLLYAVLVYVWFVENDLTAIILQTLAPLLISISLIYGGYRLIWKQDKIWKL